MPMSTKAKVFSAFISASLMLLGISPLGHSLVRAQSGTSNLDQYTKNRLGSYQRNNSVQRYSASNYANQAMRTSVPRYAQYSNVKIRNQIFGSNSSNRPKSKPFSSATRGPAVTPYLGLSGLPTGGAPNYYSNVKPQLEQQRINQRSQRQARAMQHQLNQVAAQGPYSIKGSENLAPTGHAAVHMNLGGYYPQSR
jgi:hypothetical protein